MNHRAACGQRNLHQPIGHRAGHQIGVLGDPAHDQAQGDHAGWGVALHHGRDGHRNFKGARHADQINPRLRNQFVDLLDGVFHQRIRVLFIIF